MKSLVPRVLLCAGLFAATALLAFDRGGYAYTKKQETPLLTEPKPLAESAGKLGYGHQVKIEVVQGAWLRVSEGDVSGWVFQGNLTSLKPAEVKGLTDGVALTASKTTATAAARPLDEAALKYATSSQGLTSARNDLEWMVTACAAITRDDVEQYLEQNKRGEYQ